MVSSHGFTSRLYSLPLELYDQILDLTLSAVPPKVVAINASSKPPSCLHVSRSTRATFAAVYYKDTIFEFRDPDDQSNFASLIKWLASLPRLHCDRLRTVHFFMNKHYESANERAMERTITMNAIVNGLQASGIAFRACRFLILIFGGLRYRLKVDMISGRMIWVQATV